MFHHWLSTDAETVDVDADTRLSESQCIRCGVATAEWQHGAPHFVSVSHGALSIWCEGPSVERPHHFGATGSEDDPLECHHCGRRMTGETAPEPADWECVEV